MPQVPVYQPDRVRQEPVTSAKVQPVSGGFGEAITRGIGDVAQALGQAQHASEVHADLMDHTAAKDLDMQYTAFEKSMLWDEGGLLTKKGRALLNDRPEVERQLQDKARELMSAAKSGQQQLMFGDVVKQRLQSSMDTIAKYAGAAVEDDYVATTAARKANQGDLAARLWSNPVEQQKQIATGLAELQDQRQHYGWSQDQYDAEKRDYLSSIHSAALADMVENSPATAKAYYDAHEPEMNAQTRASWGAKVGQVTDQAVAMQKADAALAASGGDLLAAMKVGETLPVKQRLFFEERVRQGYSMAQEAQRLGDDAATRKAYELAHGGTPYSLMPVDLQNNPAVIKLQDDLQKTYQASVYGQTEPEGGYAYLGFHTLAIERPQDFMALTTADLAKQHLHPKDIEKLLDMREQMKKGQWQADDLENGYKLGMSKAAPTLAGLGITNVGARNKQRLAEFQSSLMGTLSLFKRSGQTITPQLVDQAIQIALTPQAGTQPGRQPQALFFENQRGGRDVLPSLDIKTTAPELWNQAYYAMTSHLKRNPDNPEVQKALGRYEASGFRVLVPYGQIERKNRDIIEQALQKAGLDHSPAAVEEAYTANLLRQPRVRLK